MTKIVLQEDTQTIDFVVHSLPDQVTIDGPTDILLLCILQELRILNKSSMSKEAVEWTKQKSKKS